MQQYDGNVEDFNQSAQQKLDDNLLVKFYLHPVKDKALSEEAGRDIFKDVEYVDIKTPGKRDSWAGPATYAHKVKRFPRHYQAFKNRIEIPVEGTPLIEWPLMSRSMVKNLAHNNVKTVEQLADISDTLASQVMGLMGLKQKAKEWLENSNETARVNEIKTLKEENATLKEQVEGLLARFEKMDKAAEAIEEAATPKPAAKKTKAKTASKTAKV